MRRGTILLTKDGRKVGNAIVLGEFVFIHNDLFYEIETDFGNVIHLNEDEINSLFYIGKIRDIDKWRNSKYTLTLINIIDYYNRED